MNIYVGNIAYSMTNESLAQTFEPYGEVKRASIITDRDSGRSKGFAFVEMADKAAGEAAIKALDGAEVDGRNLKVNEARPRPERR